MKIKNFEEQFDKWYNERKTRYIVTPIKGGFVVFDKISCTFVVSLDGHILFFISDSEEKQLLTRKDSGKLKAIEYVNKLNETWQIELKQIYETRKNNPNIWDPMFGEFSTGRKTPCKEQNEKPKSEEKLEDSSLIQDKELTKVRI
jgi:hypothetical protein